jgi:hypothetical protein
MFASIRSTLTSSGAQSGVAIFGDVALTSRFTRLQSGQIQSAEIQELAMMPEAAPIACLGQNGQSVRWPDARHGHQSPAIGIIPQPDGSLFGDMLAEPMQIQILSEDEAEHRYGGTVERHWYSDRPLGGSVNLCEQRPLAHFAADQGSRPAFGTRFRSRQ